jgi:hypothetical protein
VDCNQRIDHVGRIAGAIAEQRKPLQANAALGRQAFLELLVSRRVGWIRQRDDVVDTVLAQHFRQQRWMDPAATIKLVLDDDTEPLREQPRLQKIFPSEPAGDENGKRK